MAIVITLREPVFNSEGKSAFHVTVDKVLADATMSPDLVEAWQAGQRLYLPIDNILGMTTKNNSNEARENNNGEAGGTGTGAEGAGE